MKIERKIFSRLRTDKEFVYTEPTLQGTLEEILWYEDKIKIPNRIHGNMEKLNWLESWRALACYLEEKERKYMGILLLLPLIPERVFFNFFYKSGFSSFTLKNFMHTYTKTRSYSPFPLPALPYHPQCASLPTFWVFFIYIFILY